MSYLVLARKWRPQFFADLVGQEHVSRTLANSMVSGRIHHAFLFTGARGVGKTSAARILAKALNCERQEDTEPCNKCDSCVEITAGKSVDVVEIDGASNNGVDDMRELRDTLRYLPAHSRYKIFIIDEVHMLSISAFNALLKTLEEPPQHVKFIFATTEPHKIPVTILSRCQRFDFRKIPAVKVVAQLRRIVDAEQIEISERSLALIAQRGGGSMRDSLSTLDQVVAFCSTSVSDADVQSLLGVVDQRLLFDVLEACMQQRCSVVLEVVRKVDDLGHSFRQFSQELIEVVRRVILCAVLDNPQEELGLFGDEFETLSRLTEMADQEDWQRLLSLLIKTETQLAASVYPRLLVEMVLVRAASLPPSCDISSLINKVELLEMASAGQQLLPRRMSEQRQPATQYERNQNQNLSANMPKAMAKNAENCDQNLSDQTAAPASAVAPVVEENPVVVERGADYSATATLAPDVGTEVPAPSPVVASKSWLEFVQYAKQQRPRIGSLLEHGSLMELKLPLVRVAFEQGSFMLQQLSDAETRERLDVVAQQFFAQPVQVTVEALRTIAEAPLSLAAAQEKRESDRGRRLREDAMSHPMVKKTLEIFSGEIEKITPIDKGFV